MAWDDDDDDDLDEDELEERDEERQELKSVLDRARKRPRHFAIIAKGPKILSLLAQKKPFPDGTLRRERRKKRGKQIIQGVCQGDGGQKMIFKVAGEAPRIKKSRLREFITNETGLMLKPRFEMPRPAK